VSIVADGFGRRTQTSIFRAGASGSEPRIPTSWPALVTRAQRAMSDEAWAYVNGSSGTESSAEVNAEAFEQWRIVPRVLRDVSERDLGVTLFGHSYATPLLASPVGVLELVDPDADLAITRAASSLGVPAILSNQASIPMERVFAEGGDGPKWFQLYWSSSDELVESLVSRAEKLGAQAIVVTLDTQMLGWRPRDLDLGFLPFIRGMGIAQYTSDPVFRRLVAERLARPVDPAAPKPKVTPAAVRTLVGMTRRHPGRFGANLRSGEPRAAVETFLDVFSRANLTWDDLAFLRSRTTLPIVLKGIQHPDDARRAVETGMDGVIVSNHAGRQIDGAIASLDALPGVVAAVGGRVPVLFDSGIRGGADVFRALALGAAAVCVGRPWVYGMAIAGEEGAREALRNVIAEFDLVLGLSGYRSVAELTPDALVRA
jgi:isopentenyl diphosphate isomerase/L-lactate dehydrogenase-like FMN-dependent dehydrogenase